MSASRWLSDLALGFVQVCIDCLIWLISGWHLPIVVLACIFFGMLPPVKKLLSRPWVVRLRRGLRIFFIVLVIGAVLWFGCIERVWAYLKYREYMTEHGGLRPTEDMVIKRNLKTDGVQVGVIYADDPTVREWYRFVIKDNYFGIYFTQHLDK